MAIDGFTFHGHNLEIDPFHKVCQPTTADSSRVGTSIDAFDAVLDDNGRTYHGYNKGSYFMPNDAEEQHRLNKQHKLYLLVTDGHIGKAPVVSPKHVLDAATGTGIWAMQYAEKDPDCQVIGSDLSLIQNSPSTPNCSFVQLDMEKDDWGFTQKFDHIHFRYVCTCFSDMKAVIQKSFDNLNPGGWIEFYDVVPVMVDVDGSFKGTAIEEWSHRLLEGGKIAGKDLLKPRNYARWCEEIGFTDVVEEHVPMPSNSMWPKDPKMKAIGMYCMENQLALVDSLTKFISLTGLSNDKRQSLEAQAKADIQDPNIHFCRDVHIIYARKPLTGEGN